MHQTNFDLQQLLAPVELDVFFHETWEKQPLAVHRHDAEYYRNLFALPHVDAVIAFTRPKFLEPADFKKSGPVVHNFVQGWLPDDEGLRIPFCPDISEVHKGLPVRQATRGPPI